MLGFRDRGSRLSPRITVLAAIVLLICGAIGAQTESTPPATNESDRLWSLRTLKGAVVPVVDAEWCRSPLDAFLWQTLQQNALTPSREADRRTVLRRVTLDVWGLPPTPEDLANFLGDDSPDAYERLIDRLLASPHLGERWARHWMDVAHFAETHGHDQDRIRPNAWPYRDYLIRAFNDDRPYSRFVQDQVAGDVLFPSDPWSLVATGFLASGPFDESSLMSIQDDTDDRRIAQYVDRDDIITTVMGSFVSLTVHCARCHDHKFDPISQSDYYRLQAVFSGVDKADRPFDADPETKRQRSAWQAELDELDQRPAREFLSAEWQQHVSDWERKMAAAAVVWSVVAPTEVASALGSQLTLQPDGSVLSHGAKPEKDTYTLTFRSELPTVTGLRLEVLTDESLAQRGPGRQDNGNLHLSEIRVTSAPVDAPEVKQMHAIRSARADFDQQGWTIQHAIDNQPATAWGVHPAVGQPHHAVFEFAEPIRDANGAVITIVLEQLHGSGHLIGRPRIAFTGAETPLPLETATLPAEIATILAVPQQERTDDQRTVLGRFVRRDVLRRNLSQLPPQQMVFTANRVFQPNGGLRPAAIPRPIYVLHRGDIRQPRDEMRPGALRCVSQISSEFEIAELNNEGNRRAALAKWLTEPENGIVWRSIVNRLWHYHFGRGMVETPNDFGVMAQEPSHSELLEWLAADFRSHGGSLKRLHRQIVTSAAYRQAVEHRADCAARDGDNRLLWRGNRRRLEAEEIRDAALLFAGRLDDRMHGPSVRQFIESPGVQITPVVDYLGFNPDQPEHTRRSVYRFLFRTLPDPYHEALDCPDASQWAPVRNESLTALQALALLHDRVLIRHCEQLGQRITGENRDVSQQLQSLYQRTLLRDPTADDLMFLLPYTEQHGLSNACRMVLNSNEFLYVE